MWNENERLLQDYSSLRNIMACVCAVWILVPAMCACVCVCRYPLILGIYYMLGMYSLRSRGVCDLCLLEILMFPVHLSLRSVKEIRKGQRGMTAVCNGHLSLSLSAAKVFCINWENHYIISQKLNSRKGKDWVLGVFFIHSVFTARLIQKYIS